LIYLLSKRKTSIFVAMTILSAFTHKYGVYFFAMIFVAEIIEKIILKITWGDKWKLPKLNLGVGFLVGQRLVSINMIINVFLNHMNIYFVYIARKSRDYFLWALFLIGLVGSINFDFRIVMLSQISLCLILGKQLEKEKPSRNFYVICILLMLLNFLSFSWQTEKFLLFS